MGSQGILSLRVNWRDILTQKLKIPLPTLWIESLLQEIIIRATIYWMLTLMPRIVYTRLHSILITAPRDRCYPCSTYKKNLSSSSVDTCSGFQSEDGAESEPKPVFELLAMPFFIILFPHRDHEGVSRLSL